MNQDALHTDTARINAALEGLVLEYLKKVCVGLVLIFILFTLFNVYRLPKEIVTTVVGLDMGGIVIFGLVYFLLFKRRIPTRYANSLVAFVVLVAFSITMFFFYKTQKHTGPVYVVMLMFGMSMVFLSRRWFFITLGIIGVGWGIMTRLILNTPDMASFFIAVLATAIIASIIQVVRISMHERFEMLRIKDEMTYADLMNSLSAKDKEIEERQKAEKEKNRLEDQLLQSQKMEAVGRLAGGIAHDINNMLSVINNSSEAMRNELSLDSDHRSDLDSILDACRRGKELTGNLLGFARKGKYRREKIDINKVVCDVESFLSRTIPKKITIEKDLAVELEHTEGDPGQLNQVLVNLLINSVDALEGEGRIYIKTNNVQPVELHGVVGLERETCRFIRVMVSDNGVGMDRDTAMRAFEPFFTTKPSGEGTGLGLAMVYGTIKNHGGTVLLKSAPGQGTVVLVYLPVYNRESIPLSTHIAQSLAPGKGEGTILLVDDEPLVRKSGKRILEQLGYSVLLAENGVTALEQYKKYRGQIRMVVLDLIMPEMDGEETFERLLSIDEIVKTFFVSGYSKDVRVENLLARGAMEFVQKPFGVEDISLALHRGIGN